ncbi:MAG: hypothetical protein SVN78_02685 [Deferribacterota bacterium]|nr:hypothetical protein [Deferribacterota bacterium]
MKKISIFIISAVFLIIATLAYTESDIKGIGVENEKISKQAGPPTSCDEGCHGRIYEMELSDPSENICLTCHTPTGVMSVFGFRAYLGALDHWPLPDEFYTHPDACVICHTGQEVHGSYAEDFFTLVHKGHLVDPEGRVLEEGNNHFVIMYGGKCTHCHIVNPDGTFSMPGMESLFEEE